MHVIDEEEELEREMQRTQSIKKPSSAMLKSRVLSVTSATEETVNVVDKDAVKDTVRIIITNASNSGVICKFAHVFAYLCCRLILCRLRY